MANDWWNRVQDVTLPGNLTGNPNQRFTYNSFARPAWIKTETLLSGSTYVTAVDYQDGFGTTIQNQTDSPTTGKRWVAPTYRDSTGRVVRESTQSEYTGNAGTGYVNPDWDTVQNHRRISYLHGGADVVSSQHAAGTALWSTRVVQSAWTTRLVNAKNRYVDETLDAFGNLSTVDERAGGGGSAIYATTEYQYDKANRLTKVTAPGNAETFLGYDLFGRKTSMNDPDSGAWTYTYDGAGNLTVQTHAGHGGSDNVITTTYDVLDRPRLVKANDVKSQQYWYDPAGNKGVSWLARQFHSDGTTLLSEQRNFSYDNRGQVTNHWDRVRPVGGAWSIFRFEHTYNEANQAVTVRYPATDTGALGEIVTYGLDSRAGLPVTMTGAFDYVTSQAY